MSRAVCTIATSSNLEGAVVIAESARRFNPKLTIAILVVPNAADSGAAPSTDCLALDGAHWFSPSDLGLSDLRTREFGYSPTHLTYALTAAFLRHLIDSDFAANLLFVKQESMVLSELSPIFDELESSEILLTPHLVPGAGFSHERELSILQSGAYNAGVLGISRGGESANFLDWWDSRLATGCRHSLAEGMHFEQRWLNLAPGLFGSVRVADDPGYNVGHWRLPEAEVALKGERHEVSGVPIRVARFSGFDVENREFATIHTDRLRIADLGVASELFEAYARAVVGARSLVDGMGPARTRQHAPEFSNGVPIPEIARDLYLRSVEGGVDFGDPFDVDAPNSYYKWLCGPADGLDPKISHLWAHVREARTDLQLAFPDHLGADRAAFSDWILASGVIEHGVDAQFVSP